MTTYVTFAMRNPKYVTKNARQQWAVRKAMIDYKEAHPVCEITGATKKLEVHHIIPVSMAPNLAAVPSNFMTLSKSAHFDFGHNRNYKNYVPNIRELALQIRETMIVQQTQQHSQEK